MFFCMCSCRARPIRPFVTPPNVSTRLPNGSLARHSHIGFLTPGRVSSFLYDRPAGFQCLKKGQTPSDPRHVLRIPDYPTGQAGLGDSSGPAPRRYLLAAPLMFFRTSLLELRFYPPSSGRETDCLCARGRGIIGFSLASPLPPSFNGPGHLSAQGDGIEPPT